MGQRIFLPRIPPNDTMMSFPLFPARLAFSVTVNKGQGQENEGVWHLKVSSAFTYHQPYAEFFRRQRDGETAAATSNKYIHAAEVRLGGGKS